MMNDSFNPFTFASQIRETLSSVLLEVSPLFRLWHQHYVQQKLMTLFHQRLEFDHQPSNHQHHEDGDGDECNSESTQIIEQIQDRDDETEDEDLK